MDNSSDTTQSEQGTQEPAAIDVVQTEAELANLRDIAWGAMQNWIMAMGRAGKTQTDVMREVAQLMQAGENEPG